LWQEPPSRLGRGLFAFGRVFLPIFLSPIGEYISPLRRLLGQPIRGFRPQVFDGDFVVSSFYDLSANDLGGGEKSLADFRGKVLLIVNVASKCGFTPQYEGLETLYRKHQEKGFAILGFPCNQFGGQEPGGASEIAEFCERNYHVSFPMFAKIDVNGEDAHPVYRFLKGEKKGLLGTEAIKWNFTKFLVDRQGHVVKRFAPTTKPEDLEKEIAVLL
jgi:glutathione peroxidase